MITIHLEAIEEFNEETNEFSTKNETDIHLEHSLLALSKWESKYRKPFLSSEHNEEEILFYIQCMNLDDTVIEFDRITADDITKIQEYLNDNPTATVISEDEHKKKESRFVTSELIYYWMAANQIPFECELWNLNRLLTLIRVCSIESQPKKKMNKRDILRNNYAKNMARRKRLGTKG